MTTVTCPILVVACGNPMAADDGFAQLVLRELTPHQNKGRKCGLGNVGQAQTRMSAPPVKGHSRQQNLVAQIDGVEVIDLGMSPTNLIDHLEGRKLLVVVDAAVCPDLPAGAMIEFDWDDPNRPQLCSEKVLSSHGMGIDQQIELARRLGTLPKVIKFIGVSIESSQIGQTMNHQVARGAQTAACRLRELVAQLQPETTHA